MKITGLKTFVVHAFRCNWVFVKLETSDGISGIGEATVEMREPTVASAVEELGRYLIGKDPFAIEHHISIMHRDSYWRSGVLLRTALSAVEGAMFDIKGKALGVPVYELLGGRCRDRVKCYANGWFAGARTPAQFGAKARAAVELGFRALKFDPFGSAYRQLEPAERRVAYEVVAAIRDAVGPDVDLLIEVHGRLDVPTAIAMAKDLEPLKPFWYEEPVAPDSLDALAEVRRRISIPVASGERFFEPNRFAEALRLEAIDYLQPDVCHVGGLLETKRVASLAMMYEKSVSPHNPNGPVCNAMTLHSAASTPEPHHARDDDERRDVARRRRAGAVGAGRWLHADSRPARPGGGDKRGSRGAVPLRASRSAPLFGRTHVDSPTRCLSLLHGEEDGRCQPLNQSDFPGASCWRPAPPPALP